MYLSPRSWDLAKKSTIGNKFDAPLEFDGQQVVVLSKVLAHDSVNVGFHSLGCIVVKSYNGKKPTNLAHLAAMVQRFQNDCGNTGMHCFRFSSGKKTYVNEQEEKVIALDAAAVAAAEKDILDTHLISATCSPDIERDMQRFSESMHLASS